jgi:hypothetical protein
MSALIADGRRRLFVGLGPSAMAAPFLLLPRPHWQTGLPFLLPFTRIGIKHDEWGGVRAILTRA